MNHKTGCPEKPHRTERYTLTDAAGETHEVERCKDCGEHYVDGANAHPVVKGAESTVRPGADLETNARQMTEHDALMNANRSLTPRR